MIMEIAKKETRTYFEDICKKSEKIIVDSYGGLTGNPELVVKYTTIWNNNDYENKLAISQSILEFVTTANLRDLLGEFLNHCRKNAGYCSDEE